MAARYLIDTDVLVEHLRGSPRAIRFLERLEGELLLSAITVAELFSAARGEEEERVLEQFVQVFEVVPVGQDQARRAGLFRRDYGRSHGTGLADALIAASAEAASAVLVTFNRRHCPMTSQVKIPYKRA